MLGGRRRRCSLKSPTGSPDLHTWSGKDGVGSGLCGACGGVDAVGPPGAASLGVPKAAVVKDNLENDGMASIGSWLFVRRGHD